jgi:hypothetical protein
MPAETQEDKARGRVHPALSAQTLLISDAALSKPQKSVCLVSAESSKSRAGEPRKSRMLSLSLFLPLFPSLALALALALVLAHALSISRALSLSASRIAPSGRLVC